MVRYRLLILVMASFTALTVKAQKKGDSLVYEYVGIYPKGDTSYFTVNYINDTILVLREYYGRTLDINSIFLGGIDTFIVYKDHWNKVFDGKTYPFLSKQAFDNKQPTIEYIRSESPPGLRNRYTPVKKIKAGNDVIYVYDKDALIGKHPYYDDTRIYFSFRYGIIGYVNYTVEMLLKQFYGKVKMELRPPK